MQREGALAAELGRTRTLAIRVAGRVGERFPDGGGGRAGGGDEMEDVEGGAEEEGEGDDDVQMLGTADTERKKVDAVLDSW